MRYASWRPIGCKGSDGSLASWTQDQRQSDRFELCDSLRSNRMTRKFGMPDDLPLACYALDDTLFAK